MIVGPKSNITHLGHAAMVLVLLRSTSTSSTSISKLYSPCWLSGRRYLGPTVGNSEPMKTFIPVCMGFSPIVFEDLHNLHIPRHASNLVVRGKIIDACRMASDQYDKIRQKDGPVMLGACVHLFESIGEEMARYTIIQRNSSHNGSSNFTVGNINTIRHQ
jgi:hypothetical protein